MVLLKIVYKRGISMKEKTNEMDIVDIIMALEGGELVLKNINEWNKVKNISFNLSKSQGFYGRLYENMCEFEENNNIEESLPITI